MFQVPTIDGGKSSSTEENTLSILSTRRHLMFIKTRTLKDKNVLSGESTMAGTRDGELFTLINQPRKEPQDGTKITVSIS
jgi:hypothetical protein